MEENEYGESNFTGSMVSRAATAAGITSFVAKAGILLRVKSNPCSLLQRPASAPLRLRGTTAAAAPLFRVNL